MEYKQPNYYTSPPPQQPKKSFWQRFRALPIWIQVPIALFVIIFVGSAAVSGIHDAIVQPSDTAVPQAVAKPIATSAPTKHVPAWTTTQTFSGHTHGKTPVFNVAPGWRLHWTCTNSTVPSGATGAVGITAYSPSGKTLSGDADDPTVTTGHCPVQDVASAGISAIQKYGGMMWLDVYITGDWSIDIEELK